MYTKQEREEVKLLEKQITNSLWFKISIIIVVIIVLCLVGYRYFLVGKAINTKQYITAITLTTPEIGLLATML